MVNLSDESIDTPSFSKFPRIYDRLDISIGLAMRLWLIPRNTSTSYGTDGQVPPLPVMNNRCRCKFGARGRQSPRSDDLGLPFRL